MRLRPFAIVLAASAPPLYAAYVYGYELTGFLTLSTRMDAVLSAGDWGRLALVAAQMVVIGAGLAVAWQAVPQARWRVVAAALGVAWVASAPLYVLLMMTRV